MIVIADSSPLRYLILLDCSPLLHQLYGRVVIPDAVAGELSSSSAPVQVRDWVAARPAWVEVVEASQEQSRP